MKTIRWTPFAARLLLLSAIAPAVACTVATSEDSGTTSDALCKDPPCGRPPPPPPPPPPGTYVTLTSDQLNDAIVFALAGSQLSVDTTETAPEVFGPSSTYPNPVWVQCQKDLAQCSTVPIAQRLMCRAEVNERCAGVPHSISTSTIEYSYLTFGAAAKSFHVNDIFFPLEQMHHDGDVFSFDIDVHYIHATFGWNVSAGFSGASAWLNLTGIQSASPTIILSGDYPDFDFTNMSASVTLDGIVPTPDGLGVDYTNVSSTFHFDWDANNVPDALVSAIVDVNSLVQERVTARIDKAFGKDTAHAGLSAALTSLINQHVIAVHPAGFSKITSVVGAGTSINVYYVGK